VAVCVYVRFGGREVIRGDEGFRLWMTTHVAHASHARIARTSHRIHMWTHARTYALSLTHHTHTRRYVDVRRLSLPPSVTSLSMTCWYGLPELYMLHECCGPAAATAAAPREQLLAQMHAALAGVVARLPRLRTLRTNWDVLTDEAPAAAAASASSSSSASSGEEPASSPPGKEPTTSSSPPGEGPSSLARPRDKGPQSDDAPSSSSPSSPPPRRAGLAAPDLTEIAMWWTRDVSPATLDALDAAAPSWRRLLLAGGKLEYARGPGGQRVRRETAEAGGSEWAEES
jgi:hypothetical protein